MAANGLLRYTFGAAFPLFTLQSELFPFPNPNSAKNSLATGAVISNTTAVYQKLGVGGATSLFGGVSVLMLPIPWILYKWGPALRAKSRYSLASEQKS